MKKNVLIYVIIILIALGGILIILRGSEDDWIKDSRGVWIKHGNPYSTPDKVKEQQGIIDCANTLYDGAKSNETNFNSQCLGKCENYSVDVVHVPRTDEDNKIENQCSDFRSGITKHFIEIDKNGRIVRIV